jgi:hypothetical protein
MVDSKSITNAQLPAENHPPLLTSGLGQRMQNIEAFI